MTNKEINEYFRELISKYDYYDPLKDRNEVFKFANIKNKNILVLECIDELTSVILVNNFKCNVMTICDLNNKFNKISERLIEKKINLNNNFELSLVSNFLENNFEKEYFDVVVAFNTIHHRRHLLKELIDEMFRISKQKVIISELNKNGAKIFDECISPEENHECLIIDHNELKNILNVKSNLRILERKLITTYVCKKKLLF